MLWNGFVAQICKPLILLIKNSDIKFIIHRKIKDLTLACATKFSGTIMK